MIAILTEYTRIKDPALYRKITPQGCNPDGRVHLPSLRNDLAFFVERRRVKDKVSVEQVVDSSFVDWAVKELGPYQRREPLKRRGMTRLSAGLEARRTARMQVESLTRLVATALGRRRSSCAT